MYACGQEFNDDVIARIAATVEQEPAISRRFLSRLVCGWLDWRAPNGGLKDMSCRTALLRLHGKGLIPLPEPGGKDLFVRKTPEQQPDIPEGIEKITGSLAELGRIEITPIEIGDRSASRTWNGLMEKYHYRGMHLTQPTTISCGRRNYRSLLVFDVPLLAQFLPPAPTICRKVYLSIWTSAD